MLKDIKAKLKDIRAKFSIGYRKLWKWHDNFEKNQIETLELKNTIIEMKIMVQSESRLDNEKQIQTNEQKTKNKKKLRKRKETQTNHKKSRLDIVGTK